MSRYFFHVHTPDGAVPDDQGQDLPDDRAALHHAAKQAKERVEEDSKQGLPEQERWFEIQDGGGNIVLLVNFADAARDRQSS